MTETVDFVISDLSAAVLAGGASSRMGQNKALLTLGSERLIERVVARLCALSNDVMVITNTPESYEFLAGLCRFVPDVTGPGQGPLAGIASALSAARHARVLVVATDMPFLNLSLLHHLARLEPQADVLVPVIAPDGFPETLHAIYGKGALPVIEAQLAGGSRKITHFFRDVRVREVPAEEIRSFDPAFRSFFNVNTPEEWAEAERLDASSMP
ncbi:MAG: molybdenum cofactor guanylyltransferase [Ardenticatenales bacterium]|nr:molybdenum cofactor guanylyltransferase [Ardenticatenales bacterium]